MKLHSLPVGLLRQVLGLMLLLSMLNARATPAEIYGRWHVTKILDVADIAAMSASEARGFIGKRILIAKDKFQFGEVVCKHPSYESTEQETARSFRELGGVSSYRMGLPTFVTTVDAGCTSLFFNPKALGRLVVHWNGYYYEALRSSLVLK